MQVQHIIIIQHYDDKDIVLILSEKELINGLRVALEKEGNKQINLFGCNYRDRGNYTD